MQSSKNGNIFQEMELFNPKLKISCFLGESFRVFHQCFFRCFHFCHAFISSDAFIVDCTSLFVRYFAFVLFIFLFLVFVDLREHFFLSDIIYLHSFLLLTRLPWGLQFHLEDCRASHWGGRESWQQWLLARIFTNDILLDVFIIH